MRLPPLNAVRAFDAVARLGSVRAAADELAVTSAAVSQQLRVLDAHLGIALVEKHGRGIALTDAGRAWHQEIARHLRAIALAAERVRPGRRVVNLTVVQSFATRWLVPKLPLFTQAHPEIEVRIDASPVLADLARDPFDLAIREGRGSWPETEAVHLFAADCHTLASPAYAATLMERGMIEWSRARLLHETFVDYWPDWIAAHGVEGIDVARGLFFSHTMLTLDAAVDGQGVALAPAVLAERELRRGALAVIDSRGYSPGTGFFLAWASRGTRTLSPAAVILRDWVIAEAATTPAVHVPLLAVAKPQTARPRVTKPRVSKPRAR